MTSTHGRSGADRGGQDVVEGDSSRRSVLVVYGSRHGSTREIAQAVAAALAERGSEVELHPAAAMRGALGERALVVVGGALYSGRWHRDAKRFLRRHRDELMQLPVAVFASGPRETDAAAWARSRLQLDRELARRPWLEPVTTGLFGGADPPRRGARARRDARDWQVVRAWATDLTARREG